MVQHGKAATKKTESWQDRIMYIDSWSSSLCMILSGHDSVLAPGTPAPSVPSIKEEVYREWYRWTQILRARCRLARTLAEATVQ